MNQFTTSTFVGESSTQQQNSSILDASGNSFLSKSTAWILDSGATDHVTPFSFLLHNSHSISPNSVKIPNGTTVIAKLAGSVHFSTDFQLHNVLHVPEFTCNIISASQLVQNRNYKFTIHV